MTRAPDRTPPTVLGKNLRYQRHYNVARHRPSLINDQFRLSPARCTAQRGWRKLKISPPISSGLVFDPDVDLFAHNAGFARQSLVGGNVVNVMFLEKACALLVRARNEVYCFLVIQKHACSRVAGGTYRFSNLAIETDQHKTDNNGL
jgi:hypothetical protein